MADEHMMVEDATDEHCDRFHERWNSWLATYLTKEVPDSPGTMLHPDASSILQALMPNEEHVGAYATFLEQVEAQLLPALSQASDFSEKIPPKSSDAPKLLLRLSQIGYGASASVKGPSPVPSVKLCMKKVMCSGGNETDKYPLVVTFDLAGEGGMSQRVPGLPIGRFTVGLEQGMAVATTCHLMMAFLQSAGLLEEIVRGASTTHEKLARNIASCLRLHAVAVFYRNSEELVYESLRGKRHAALRQGPNPIQIATALERILPDERKKYPRKTNVDLVQGILNRFSKMEKVGRARYSSQEVKAVKLLVVLLELSPRTVDFIRSVWAKNVMSQSAITVETLACAFLDRASPNPISAKDNPPWSAILAWSVQKVHEFILTCACTYDNNVMTAAKFKKNLKLETTGHTFRLKNYEEAWRCACMNVSGLPTMRANLTTARLEQVLQMCRNSTLCKDAEQHTSSLDPGFIFDHVRYMRKTHAGVDDDGMELQMVTTEKLALIAESQASVKLFGVKLLRQRTMFSADLVRVRDWETESMGEYRKLLLAQKDAYDAVVGDVVDRGFHVFSGVDPKAASSKFLRAIDEYAAPSTPQSVQIIHVFDMAKFIQLGNVDFKAVVAAISSMIDRFPENSCAIVYEPIQDPKSAKQWGELQKELLDPSHGLQCRSCTSLYDAMTQSTLKRKLTLDAVMCVSGRGSDFEKSQLWAQQGVPTLLPYFDSSEIQDWSKLTDATENIDQKLASASSNSGVQLVTAWLQAALLGSESPRSSQHKGFVCEWSLWDDCVAEACLECNTVARAKSGLPTMAWGGAPVSRQSSQAIVSNVASSLRTTIEGRIKDHRNVVMGFNPPVEPKPRPDSQKPVVQESLYELTYPRSCGTLPIRADELKKLEILLEKVCCKQLQQELKDIVALHNNEINKAKDLWVNPVSGDQSGINENTGTSGQKRGHEGKPTLPDEVEPIHIHKKDTEYANVASFSASVKDHTIVSGVGKYYENYFAPNATVWYVNCLKDFVIERESMGAWKGKFKHGAAATAVLQGGGSYIVGSIGCVHRDVFDICCAVDMSPWLRLVTKSYERIL